MLNESIKLFPRFIKKVLYEHDISGLNLDINRTQTKILMLVYEYTERPMFEISLMAGLDKSSFTRSVDYLVKNGFLDKKPPEKDRRKIFLSLTDKGLNAAQLITRDLDFYFESMLEDFSKEERSEFTRSMDTVLRYINRILEPAGKGSGRGRGNQ